MIRALTPEIYAAIAGAPPERDIRGFAVIERERPVIAFGLVEDDIGRMMLVSEFEPEFRLRLSGFAERRLVAEGFRKAHEMLETAGPVYASASEKHPRSVEFLERLGFEPLVGPILRRAPAREAVLQAERLMKERGTPVEIPVRHIFSDGVYAREITIPADTILTGKIHKRQNLNFLLKGEISVSTERGMERLVAPATIVSPPGTKRIAYAHTEVVWTTVHGTYETDLKKIEAEFVCETEAEYLAFARQKVAA